jgi:hypothetical protein
MGSHDVVLWKPQSTKTLPSSITKPESILRHAVQLSDNDKLKIKNAFDHKLYDMALEHVWRRTIVLLKQQLSTLGVQFIGEILSKQDVDDGTPIDYVLTEYEAINLSHELGIITNTAALKLKQLFELLNHFAKPDVEDDLSFPDAFQGLSTCVQFVLSSETTEIVINFANFRNRLENETIPESDMMVTQLKGSAYFYKRTTIRVLLALIKTRQAAKLENSLANIDLLLPLIWHDIKEPDRWNVGQTYAELSTTGKPEATSVIRKVLLKLKGFDYVPENLRSKTFLKIAEQILQAHDNFNNFYTEPIPTAILSKLGSTIPTPALPQCMSALLSVRLGNYYGKSNDAQVHVKNALKTLSIDRWGYYLNECLPTDRRILEKLSLDKPKNEWFLLINEYNLNEIHFTNVRIKKLIEYSHNGRVSEFEKTVKTLYNSIGLP